MLDDGRILVGLAAVGLLGAAAVRGSRTTRRGSRSCGGCGPPSAQGSANCGCGSRGVEQRDVSVPFATWKPKRRRYVEKQDVPLPAFESVNGNILIWDMDTPYEPQKVLIKNGGPYFFRGLRDPASADPDDLYTIDFDGGETQADVVRDILEALDVYPHPRDANVFAPILFDGARKTRGQTYGEVGLRYNLVDLGDLHITSGSSASAAGSGAT